MRIPRIHLPAPLNSNTKIELDANAFNHCIKVLRLKEGYKVILFNGEGGEYKAELSNVQRRSASAKMGTFIDNNTESPLNITLAQCISRGDKMDYSIQKAVELGITAIQPLFSERCGVKLQSDRQNKKQEQWQNIAISACEQSGRNLIPTIHAPQNLDEWLESCTASCKLTLAPTSLTSLKQLNKPEGDIVLLIGPEGGLSDQEIEQTAQQGFTGISLGPRILRTETAGLVVLSALQYQWGDLA